jgi:NADH:ubiquinone oxidoreductase subunit 2 (subunit N)
MSAVSFYYYLQVLKQVYVLDAAEDAPAIKVPVLTTLALVVLAALVVLFGCAPGLLTQFL